MDQFRKGSDDARIEIANRIMDMLEASIRLTIVEQFDSKTGGLARSWVRDRIVDSSQNVRIRMFSRAPHARILHEGGTIYPKTVSRLAIPVLQHLRDAAIWPRDLPRKQLYATTPPGQTGVLIDKASGQPWYVLKLSQRVEPTKYVSKALLRVRSQLQRTIKPYYKTAIDKGAR